GRSRANALNGDIMFVRYSLAFALLAGVFTVANLPYAGTAHAERVFNTMTRQWEEVDPMRQAQLRRNPPAKFKRRTVMVRTNEAPGTIIIDTNRKYLYQILDNNLATRY